MTDTEPRSHGRRILYATMIDAVVLLASFGTYLLADAVTGAEWLARLALVLPMMAFTAWFAPRVSYRRRDVLLLLFMGYVFWVVSWRVAYLPHRDWRPRPDEKGRARWATEPRLAGTWSLPAD
ncbi:hypothetical protein [Micromonospora auratinigra]|uniref:hypothetical protein n=1 Tax=Micromonospora auratinigra TaxID=261654 RepID=UPI0012FE5A4C|nr:hypothetical protein [Micromonospora auratinigra]